MATYSDSAQRKLDEDSGIEMDRTEAARFILRLSQSITLLYINGVLTSAEKEKARTRFNKMVEQGKFT